MNFTDTDSEASISILIRAFNSAKTLDLLLEKLRLKNHDELIIVDSGSTDQTLRIAADHDAVMVKAEGKFNYSKSLNLGFQAAKNPWVLVLSSHVIPMMPDILELYRLTIKKIPQEVMAAYGDSLISRKKLSLSTTLQTSVYNNFNAEFIIKTGGNANALYRKCAWERQRFDETLLTAEDKIWMKQILQAGFSVAYVPFVPVINQNQYSPWYMFYKGYRDRRADWNNEHSPPMSPWQLCWGLAGMIKKFLCGEFDFGGYIRVSAHIAGQFCGSYARQKNKLNE
jgi:glycosyltransferase involved in cell wall biosynthesis